jgi:hypothetical protein
MSIFTSGDFTQSVEEIKGINEAIKEQAFQLPALTELHTAVEGIIVDQRMVILGRLEGLLGAQSGGCDPTSSANAFGGVEKLWSPKRISDRLTQCYDDLEGRFTAWGLKFGIQAADLTGTDFAEFVVELIATEMAETVLRNVWFGDVDADEVSEGGNLTDGTNLAYFNKINGLWKQAFAIVGADSARLSTGLASKNGQATYALQKFNATDTTNKVVMTALDAMTTDADERLIAKSDIVLAVTKSVYDQYKRELKFSNIAFTTERFEGGIESLMVDGIKIVSVSFWDRMIKAYYNDGTKYYLPHRAILLSVANTQVATDSVGTFTEIDIIFDRTTKKNHFDFEFKLDAKFAIDYEIQVAY